VVIGGTTPYRFFKFDSPFKKSDYIGK
jgi:hypothetical protein